jgi:short-subunit dehydrogenase involved in D-alanine esterification of teichoic acids
VKLEPPARRGRNPQPQDGIDTVRIDVTDPDSILSARDEVLRAHPDLDVVVTMSGVLLTEDLRDPAHAAAAETTIATNLLGTTYADLLERRSAALKNLPGR